MWVSGQWVVDSGCHELSENIWFVWSKTIIQWIYRAVQLIQILAQTDKEISYFFP